MCFLHPQVLHVPPTMGSEFGPLEITGSRSIGKLRQPALEDLGGSSTPTSAGTTRGCPLKHSDWLMVGGSLIRRVQRFPARHSGCLCGAGQIPPFSETEQLQASDGEIPLSDFGQTPVFPLAGKLENGFLKDA